MPATGGSSSFDQVGTGGQQDESAIEGSRGPAGGIGWYMVHLEPHRSRAQALQPDHKELQRSVVGEGL